MWPNSYPLKKFDINTNSRLTRTFYNDTIIILVSIMKIRQIR